MKHAYEPVRMTTIMPACSCGWRASTTSQSEQVAADLFVRHVTRHDDQIKADARRRLRRVIAEETA